ncbi:MAG: hypothetical protein JNL10_09170 [Verrucomicrobiales bacterium]|nr:hypothetical protein [Verrucomicrobiales bacterium]
MNPPDPESASREERLAQMLANPPLFPDPVFPKTDYLPAFGRDFFGRLLTAWGKPESVAEISDSGSSPQMVMLRVGWLAFWAFDFGEKSRRGVDGREEFLSRVKEPIRRPPPEMAALVMEQHLVARGVLNIQISEGPDLKGEYEICKLKTIGWYAAELVMPPRPDPSPGG